MMRVVHPGSGYRIQGSKRHPILDPDPQHWVELRKKWEKISPFNCYSRCTGYYRYRQYPNAGGKILCQLEFFLKQQSDKANIHILFLVSFLSLLQTFKASSELNGIRTSYLLNAKRWMDTASASTMPQNAIWKPCKNYCTLITHWPWKMAFSVSSGLYFKQSTLKKNLQFPTFFIDCRELTIDSCLHNASHVPKKYFIK